MGGKALVFFRVRRTKLEAHQTFIHVGEEWPGEVNHVYLDAIHREVAGKLADKLVLIVQTIKRPKDLVDPTMPSAGSVYSIALFLVCFLRPAKFRLF